ncbi:DUF2624 domain-containing protein [Sediminibacillus massiliensis]|uniref:DUF2624 domain-containing protein n=1 Tax=Sediminibacillus massiliensis TaxID=1926277 RepID=UPI0009887CBB|nr:DUF2624 domain-containing protein [Sediminibacillus massiliensis]
MNRNKMLESMVIKKIRQLSTNDLLHYSKQYDIPLTKQQADQIVATLKNETFNPLEENDRMKMFKKLAQITDVKTAQKANKLFRQLTKAYGIDSWFQ